ncbi:uncharacterized protein L201_005421 [Kwoniella dendrophila CBS 6074]|uniref:Two-component system sensor protein n=1 Tax=Kwoniella dendrophila CBS 6074 TaxID=1295534 RepID=A0AAX4K124_9TREE
MTIQQGIDLNTIPRDYLNLYPHPAFVLIVPLSPENLNSSRSLVWSNARWQNHVRGKSLLECLDIDGARNLGKWITEGQPPINSTSGDYIQQETKENRKNDWSSYTTASSSDLYTPSYDRQEVGANKLGESSKTESLYSPRSQFQSALRDEDNQGVPGYFSSIPSISSSAPETINTAGYLLDLIHPIKAKFELIKTSMPIWRIGKNGSRVKMQTHSYLIITSIPRSKLDTNSSEYSLNTPPPISPTSENLAVSEVTPKFELKPPSTPKTTILSPTTSPSYRSLTKPLPSTSLPKEEHSSLKRKSTTEQDKGPNHETSDFKVNHKKPSAIRFGKDGKIMSMKPSFVDGYKSVHDLMNTTDWSKTSLGPQENWPQSLKTTVSLVLDYPHQCCLWWGKDLTLIYNEPYAKMMHKHPHIFGMSGTVAWAEIWDALGPLSELALSGQPITKEDDFLLFKQLPHQGTGFVEEYHSWMWVPVLQEDGTFGGLWNATISTTSKVLAQRRVATVQEMGQKTSIARTMQEFDDGVIDILSSNARDVPFAAFYHVDIPTAKDKRGSGGSTSVEVTRDGEPSGIVKLNVRLAGTVGIPDQHPTTPSNLNLSIRTRLRSTATSIRHGARSPSLSIVSSMSGPPLSTVSLDEYEQEDDSKSLQQWPIREALSSNRLVMVEDCQSLINDFPIRVWDELPTAAVVIPIANESDDNVPSAVLILGLNLRRPFDEDYEAFILSSGIAAVRSYEAERQRVEELAALDRAKSLLFSNISHELRTPLTLIAGPLDDLLHETSEGPRKENLVMARRNVRRLTRLVSTLMDVSRLEAGRLQGSFQLVNLGTMTKELADLFKSAMKQANLQYTINCDVTPRAVYVDTEHWEKVVFNIIGNAMKYTMEGFVSVRLKYTNKEAIFTVQDSGVGIPASDITLVGERFHRVQSVSRSHEGTGIGLAFIKELIKLHGGVLSIHSQTALESVDGQHGSTFSVKIPLGAQHLPSDDVQDDQIVKTTQTTYGQEIIDEAMQWTRDRENSNSSSVDGFSEVGSIETTSRSSRSLDPSTLYFKKEDTIMLVDDSNDTRRYMRSIFAPLCTVIEARDGLEALRLCEKSTPDLIISDVMMPNLDGFGLLEALKSSKELSIIPIIMLTARGGDEAKVDGLLAGADDYLGKPFNSRELVARAHMQLQLGKRRKSLEEAFEQRTLELRALTDYSPVGIFRTDDVGNFTFTNNTWHELSGYPLDEPVDRWADFIAEDSRPAMLEFWDRVLSGNDEEVWMSHDFQYTNGLWGQLKAIRMERMEDKIGSRLKGILGCVNDITERKLNEESQRLRVIEADQRRKEAEEAKRQQELLIDITSHEIRNPISSLMQISLLDLLRYKQLVSVHEEKTSFIPTKQLLINIEEDLDALESIYQCGLAQERISNDVLSLGKIQLEMFDVEVDMTRETQKVMSIFQNEARMKRINLSLILGEGLQILGLKTVKTDPVRLNQIVTNLLSNAIRFTATSHVRRITLKFDVSLDPPLEDACVMPRQPLLPKKLADDQPIYLYFAVTDTGPGMTEAELEMLFQRFSQVSLKTHTIFGGSGLGLFVCRLGGKIDVTSQKGKGSTFRFFITARTCQTSSSETGESRDLSKKSTLVKSKKKDVFQLQNGKKPHVLIVEDNLINQTVLSRQLRHCNITCDVASNGLEALEKIRKVSSIDAIGQQPYDCVLMDLEMPVMDGLTALDHVREEEGAGQLKRNLVIALTGNARQGQIDEAKARGMDEVVIKPYRLDDLLQKVEEMLKLRAQEMSQPTSPQLQ